MKFSSQRSSKSTSTRGKYHNESTCTKLNMRCPLRIKPSPQNVQDMVTIPLKNSLPCNLSSTSSFHHEHVSRMLCCLPTMQGTMAKCLAA